MLLGWPWHTADLLLLALLLLLHVPRLLRSVGLVPLTALPATTAGASLTPLLLRLLLKVRLFGMLALLWEPLQRLTGGWALAAALRTVPRLLPLWRKLTLVAGNCCMWLAIPCCFAWCCAVLLHAPRQSSTAAIATLLVLLETFVVCLLGATRACCCGALLPFAQLYIRYCCYKA